MDEQSWLNCLDPQAMLKWLKRSGKLSERKLRLFGCACVRRIWHLLTDERSRAAVEVSEKYVDAQVTQDELWAAQRTASSAALEFVNLKSPRVFDYIPALSASLVAQGELKEVIRAADATLDVICYKVPINNHSVRLWLKGETDKIRPAVSQVIAKEQRSRSTLIRDLFGNPFRPAPTLDPSWLTPEVVALAQRAYEERKLPEGTLDPELLAGLADALEDAGCTDPDILRHCRWEQGHVRGCWLIDQILGRS